MPTFSQEAIKEMTETFRKEMSDKTRYCEGSKTQWLYTEDLQTAIKHVAESAVAHANGAI